MDTKFIQVLMLFVCVFLGAEAQRLCSYWDRMRCYPKQCHIVRRGRGLVRADCLTMQESLLLEAAYRGGATGPGTGIVHHGGHINDRSERIQVNVNIDNTNNNKHIKSNSGNVDVSQAQASSNSNADCVACGPGGTCVDNLICMYDPSCAGNLGCRLPAPHLLH
ncbi:uncharacterized protein LOC123553994 isoform X1 [Mercenaria mercenaria]|uniref:uncharacterized protein LOC123553994 isoform X1 n=1 Tax=Mercenaria mercenaria TaxID=6596 RepID=UPI00234EBDB7|nr:uncharacterized protein LOC123553994 isoform X1 [Mercenaria mercenaria]